MANHNGNINRVPLGDSQMPNPNIQMLQEDLLQVDFYNCQCLCKELAKETNECLFVIQNLDQKVMIANIFILNSIHVHSF